MTKCKRCGNWFDWYGTQASDVFPQGAELADFFGLGNICEKSMRELIEEQKGDI